MQSGNIGVQKGVNFINAGVNKKGGGIKGQGGSSINTKDKFVTTGKNQSSNDMKMMNKMALMANAKGTSQADKTKKIEILNTLSKQAPKSLVKRAESFLNMTEAIDSGKVNPDNVDKFVDIESFPNENKEIKQMIQEGGHSAREIAEVQFPESKTIIESVEAGKEPRDLKITDFNKKEQKRLDLFMTIQEGIGPDLDVHTGNLHKYVEGYPKQLDKMLGMFKEGGHTSREVASVAYPECGAVLHMIHSWPEYTTDYPY